MADANVSRRGFFGHAAGAYALLTAIPLGGMVAADPLLTFLAEWEQRGATFEALPDDVCDAYFDEHLSPMNCAVRDGNIPAATTAGGAAAALRKAILYSDMEDADAGLIRAALAFLDQQAA